MYWYRLAADQGDAAAQFNLGVMYDNGRGVLKDEAEAVRWYRLAAEQGDADARGQCCSRRPSRWQRPGRCPGPSAPGTGLAE